MSVEEVIAELTPQTIFNKETIFEIYDTSNEVERAVFVAQFKAKAKEFKLEKEATEIIKALNHAEKNIIKEFNKFNALGNAEIELNYDGRGQPLSTVDNFLRIFHGDKAFSGLKFNLLTYSPEKTVDGKTERWTDTDDARTRHYVEAKYKLSSLQKCDDALRIVFAENEYHPIKNIINSLKWDGESRIFDFLNKWTKCENTQYTREVSRLIFAGGINRLYNPGCKFDDMPVLIGTQQGEGKSTLVRWIALKDEYFSEINEIEGQRGIEAVEGAWICEMGELLALTKVREVEAVKSYLTRQNDRYRMPFDKRVTDHKRQCIFIGTTNKEQFLTDKTGNRRFYPVKIKQNGYDLFACELECREYIKQCWAEAKVLYDKGELLPYANKDLAKQIRAAQSTAVEDDYRDGMIEDYLIDRDIVCVMGS